MSALTTSPSTIRLYHNPGCSKSRGALELLTGVAQRDKLDLEVIEYLKAPLNQSELLELLKLLPDEPLALVRNDKNFKALGLDIADYGSPEAISKLLVAHPELMQRPIALFNNAAAIGRPRENLENLFA